MLGRIVGVVLACALGGGVGPAGDKLSKEHREAFVALAEQARDAKPEKRRSAVRALAEFGGEEAWRLVFAALEDTDSSVGDAAQRAIGRLADPKLALELCGPAGLGSKEERVQLRAAEAFGRLQVGVDAERLARELSPRGGERDRLLVWSIERLAAGGKLLGDAGKVVRELERLERADGDKGLAGAALCALAELAPARALDLARDSLRDRNSDKRCAAALVLGRLKPPDALGEALRLASDADARVRMRGIECLDAIGTRASMLAIVGRLANEPRLRVRWRAVDLLQRASGLKHRLDPRPWKLWAEELPEGGVLKRGMSPEAAAKAEAQGATRASGFAGLSILSDHVAFLFDFSGSMWTPMADGRIPKDIVDAKLRLALEALPESTEFNLIPFTNVPIPYAPEARTAKRAEVQKALEWFSKCREKGRGNFYDAARIAMVDPAIDTIVVLTDGVPTGGLHSEMDLIVALLAERARTRPIVIDSILVDAPPGTAKRWRELAERTGGRSIEVDLSQP